MVRKKILTAAEVRELPIGTAVELHGYDRYGSPSWLELTVVQSGRKKILTTRDYYGNRIEKQIRDYPNKWYAIKEE